MPAFPRIYRYFATAIVLLVATMVQAAEQEPALVEGITRKSNLVKFLGEQGYINHERAVAKDYPKYSIKDVPCPTEPPINFIWLGSDLSLKQKQNLSARLRSGHPVILWYIPRAMMKEDRVSLLNIEKIYSGVLVLDLTEAGLDDLYPREWIEATARLGNTTGHEEFSISQQLAFLANAGRVSSKQRKMFAVASNLGRISLMVKGQSAIRNAVRHRNMMAEWTNQQIDQERELAIEQSEPVVDDESHEKRKIKIVEEPYYSNDGMIYMDTDIYHDSSGEIYLPETMHDYGIHIFRDGDGVLWMNNDLLYSAYPEQPFFRDLLNKQLAKFVQANRDKNYTSIWGAHPPCFNGAFFTRAQLNADLLNEPSIFLQVEPQKMEGNWHDKTVNTRVRLPGQDMMNSTFCDE